MNHDLVERYLYAVTKQLPRSKREDVSRELRSLIEDMLTERCGEVTPTEKDIRVVLTELGTPQELYAQYDEDAKKCLIGQPYYSTYKSVLKVVLLSVAGGLTVANLILQMIEPKEFFDAVTAWLSGVWDGLISSFAIVTVLFSVFYHKGIRISEPFNFDNLPSVPKKNEVIPKWEPIVNIGICILFAVLLVFTPQVFCAIREGTVISLFDVDAMRVSWPIILLFAACGIVREAVQLMEGRYNRKVWLTALVSDALSALICSWWLLGFDVMNPTFLANVKTIFEGETNLFYRMFAEFDVFFLGLIILALVLDAIDVSVKTLRK